jgi:hypothetical protein
VPGDELESLPTPPNNLYNTNFRICNYLIELR